MSTVIARRRSRRSNPESTAQTRPPSMAFPARATARRSERTARLGYAGPVPTARALAIDVMAVVGDGDGVLELDEPTGRVHERRLDRAHHSRFERLVGIFVRIRHRPAVGQPRRLMAHEAHAVREEFEMVVVLRLLHERLGRGVDFAAPNPGADRPHAGALDLLDFGEQIL